MQQRSVVTPWRLLGQSAALLAGLMVAQPVMAGDFFLDAEGTPDLAVFIDADKRGVVANEVIEYRLLVRNYGTGVAPAARVKLTLLEHAEYVAGSTTVNGLPYPDHWSGNPLLQGVEIGDVEPGADVVVRFKAKVEEDGDPTCPIKLMAVALNEGSGPAPTPPFQTPVIIGHPNIEFAKLGDMTVAGPGQVITYRFVVRNTGNGNALDVRVQDGIPTHTQYVPGSTEVNGQPVPDHLGGSPLEAGMSVGDIPAFASPVTVSMKVRVTAQVPMGAAVRNTARWSDGGVPPNTPSNTVTTPLVPRPTPADPDQPHVPNVITPVPTTGRGIVTGTPTDITVCPTDCEPTTANIHVSTDSAQGIASTWMQVVGLHGAGGATIQPSLGLAIGERLARAGFIAPGTDSVFFAAFPEPGGRVDVVLSLTDKSLQLVMLDQIMQAIAKEAGLGRPTPTQVLSMYNRVPSIPSLKAALESFGPVPAPPPVPVASDTPFTLSRPNPAQLEELTFELQMSSQEVMGLLYTPSDVNAFRDALTTVLGQPVANAHIRQVARWFGEPTLEMEELRNELSLVLKTRTTPARVSFVADYRPQ